MVVNLAAQAGVRYSITNPDAYVESNLVGFFNILEACRHCESLEHLVYASSSSVYGSNKKVPYSTDDKVDKSFRYQLTEKTKGKIVVGRLYTQLINEVKSADIVLHAPGGPSIGDVYYDAEPGYLYFYKLLCAMKVPYMFFAPSMGPFLREERNKLRRYILSHASAIALRDPISAKYVREFLPEKRVYQTLDSAFQHDIDMAENKEKLEAYSELCSFLNTHKRCVGITITDLLWHPVHSKDGAMIANIQGSFEAFLKTLVDKGYGIVFIPQLYGTGNDYKLMSGFATGKDSFFTIPDSDDRYDSYFQQYVIGQLYAVVGMRYHSNIFSAKMGTPFISVSYEQKIPSSASAGTISQGGILAYFGSLQVLIMRWRSMSVILFEGD